MGDDKTKYVIRMQDRGYYRDTDDAHNVITTANIDKAHFFETRWDALITAGTGKIFAYASIMPYRLPERGDMQDARKPLDQPDEHNQGDDQLNDPGPGRREGQQADDVQRHAHNHANDQQSEKH